MMFWVTDPAGPDAAFYLDPILLKSEGRGTVRLASADPGDQPRISLPSLSDRDVDRLAEGYRRGLELAHHPAIRGLALERPPEPPGSDAELRRRVIDGSYSMPHVVGTCRMGPEATDGDVVDQLGRVHGIERLSVIDASIIPDAPAGFPQIVTIMLAEKLSPTVAALVEA
jgi:choline dehydrogenase-like flavoprotein